MLRSFVGVRCVAAEAVALSRANLVVTIGELIVSPGASNVIPSEVRLSLDMLINDFDELEPLAVKGKADPIQAFRLLAAREASERGRGERFVGRERELALIASAWERARRRSHRGRPES